MWGTGAATWGGQTRNPQPQSGIGFASYCNDDREGSKILFERGPVNNGSDPGIGEVMADSSKTTAESRRRPDPNENLVKIFDTEQESEAMVVNGLLESAGIDCDMTALSAPQDTFPGVGGTIILVREEDADMPPPIDVTTAERLRAARGGLGLSQDQLAEHSGFQRAAISHFETGRRKPSLRSLKRLADVLDVSADYLLGRSER